MPRTLRVVGVISCHLRGQDDRSRHEDRSSAGSRPMTKAVAAGVAGSAPPMRSPPGCRGPQGCGASLNDRSPLGLRLCRLDGRDLHRPYSAPACRLFPHRARRARPRRTSCPRRTRRDPLQPRLAEPGADRLAAVCLLRVFSIGFGVPIWSHGVPGCAIITTLNVNDLECYRSPPDAPDPTAICADLRPRRY